MKTRSSPLPFEHVKLETGHGIAPSLEEEILVRDVRVKGERAGGGAGHVGRSRRVDVGEGEDVIVRYGDEAGSNQRIQYECKARGTKESILHTRMSKSLFRPRRCFRS
jgi:hypothetical protein